MAKIGDRNIGSIYVSHVCTSHKIFIDLSMIYMYKIDYINFNIYKIFVDSSMTYMYKMGHMNIEHKIFVDPSIT